MPYHELVTCLRREVEAVPGRVLRVKVTPEQLRVLAGEPRLIHPGWLQTFRGIPLVVCS